MSPTLHDLIIVRLRPRLPEVTAITEALDFIDALELEPHGSIALLVSRVPLQLAPELMRIGLAYNVNPLTGHRRGDRAWIIRNTVRLCYDEPLWSVPDCFPEAVTDMVIATRDPKRFFDIEPVRKPHDPKSLARAARGGRMMTARVMSSARAGGDQRPTPEGVDVADIDFEMNPNGAPPNDWWLVDRASEGAWTDVRDKLVASMVPDRVCTTCGAPSRRVLKASEQYAARKNAGKDFRGARGLKASTLNAESPSASMNGMTTASYETIAWTICGHATWRAGTYTEVSWP